MKANNAEPDLITFSTMIKGYCKQGYLSKSFQMLEMMTQASIVPDEVLYNSLLDGCVRSNEIELGLKVFDSMQQRGIPPSNVTYSILIKLYGRAKTPDKALAIIDDMKKLGLDPSPVVYTCLIKTCLKAKKIDEALNIFKKMTSDKVRPDSITYNTMITGCLENNFLKEAAEISITALTVGSGDNSNLECYKELLGRLQTRTDAESQRLFTKITALMKTAGEQSKKDSFGIKSSKWSTEETAFQRKNEDKKHDYSKRDKTTNRHKENIDNRNCPINPKSKFSAFIEKTDNELTDKPFKQISSNTSTIASVFTKGFTAQPIVFDQKVFTFKNSKKAEQSSQPPIVSQGKLTRLV
jgi:pentatricopeptide repeat protein